VLGERATAIDAMDPGKSGLVSLRGTNWTGINRGESTIPAGAMCRVERSEGLILDVRVED
jgi:membrane protein implicated in regulation of membrane protease activity